MRELYGDFGPLTSEQVAVEVAHLLDPAAPTRTGQIIPLDAGIGVLGTESPRSDGKWWLAATAKSANGNGNGRSLVARLLARLSTFITTFFP